MAGGGGLAQSPLLPTGAALALLGLLVYLGALCAACRRYVLPAHSMCCPPPLCFPSWRWGRSVALGTAQGDPVCVHPELEPLGSAALLVPNLQLQPQHNPSWADPAPLSPPPVSPCTQRSWSQLVTGTWPHRGSCGKDGDASGDAGAMPVVPGTAQGVQDAIETPPPSCRAGKGAGWWVWGCCCSGERHMAMPIVARSGSWGVHSPAWLSSTSPCSKGRRKKVPPDGVKLVDEVSACWGGQDQLGSCRQQC